MIGKNFKYARDEISHLLHRRMELPEKLYLQSDSKAYDFTINFLRNSSKEELAKLKQEGDKKEKNFILIFYTLPEKAQHKSPYQIQDFKTFDFSKVVEIRYNANTIPLLPKKEGEPIPNMSVIFVVKD